MELTDTCLWCYRLEVLDTDDAVAISTAISELNVAFSMRVISSIFSAQSGDGRLLYPVFYELPSEEELPVYYEVIDQVLLTSMKFTFAFR